MAFGTKGSVRETWHFIHKAISQNPELQFDEFYNDPRTQKQISLIKHQLGPEKCEERIWELFSSIKQQLGYEEIEEDECECDEEETLAEQMNREYAERNKNYKLTESIFRANFNNPRYVRVNSADEYGFIGESGAYGAMMIDQWRKRDEEEEEDDIEYNADLVENDVEVMTNALESAFEMDVNYVIDWQVRGQVAAGISFTLSNGDLIFNDYDVQEIIDEIDDQISGQIDFYINDTELEVEISYNGIM